MNEKYEFKDEAIRLVEVGPRDGLQNEKNSENLTVENRAKLILKLAGAGLKFLEGGSFVSPKAVPQMADSEKVWENLRTSSHSGASPTETPISADFDLSFLLANSKGFERALSAKVKSISVFTATSDSFARKNIGMSVAESLQVFASLLPKALAAGMRVRAYLSTVFGCPYEGPQDHDRVLKLTDELFKMGCSEVAISDTIGVANARQVKQIFRSLKTHQDIRKIAAHFHDTRGIAAANILVALEEGVRIFDSSIGGMGGCPYAPGSSGNVATEEVVWLLEGLGLKTVFRSRNCWTAANGLKKH